MTRSCVQKERGLHCFTFIASRFLTVLEKEGQWLQACVEPVDSDVCAGTGKGEKKALSVRMCIVPATDAVESEVNS